MRPLIHGFADELIKVAGVAGIAGAAARNPMKALGLGLTVGWPAAAAYSGFKKGRGSMKPRYLAASPEGPSRAAFINFHKFLPHTMSAKQQRKLSKNYKARNFA